MIDRKPPAKMESTQPHSIRFTPRQWGEICEYARQRAEEPSRSVRRLTMYALSVAQAQALMRAHTGTTSMGEL